MKRFSKFLFGLLMLVFAMTLRPASTEAGYVDKYGGLNAEHGVVRVGNFIFTLADNSIVRYNTRTHKKVHICNTSQYKHGGRNYTMSYYKGYLYITYNSGVLRVNTNTKKVKKIATTKNTSCSATFMFKKKLMVYSDELHNLYICKLNGKGKRKITRQTKGTLFDYDFDDNGNLYYTYVNEEVYKNPDRKFGSFYTLSSVFKYNYKTKQKVRIASNVKDLCDFKIINNTIFYIEDKHKVVSLTPDGKATTVFEAGDSDYVNYTNHSYIDDLSRYVFATNPKTIDWYDCTDLDKTFYTYDLATNKVEKIEDNTKIANKNRLFSSTRDKVFWTGNSYIDKYKIDNKTYWANENKIIVKEDGADKGKKLYSAKKGSTIKIHLVFKDYIVFNEYTFTKTGTDGDGEGYIINSIKLLNKKGKTKTLYKYKKFSGN